VIIVEPTLVRHGCIMADWSCRFEDQITLPDGRTFSTQREAAEPTRPAEAAIAEARPSYQLFVNSPETARSAI